MSPMAKRLLAVVAGGGCSVWALILAVVVGVAAWLPTAIAEDKDDAENVSDQSVCAATGDAKGPTSKEQRRNAAAITAVARQRHLPARAAVIAVATAMQESRLRNVAYGDRDSLGLFQQRPSQNWGTAEQVRDPVYAAGEFYDRMVKIPNWEHKPLTKVAQGVQRSAYPDAYAKHEAKATDLVRKVWGEGVPTGLNACSGPGPGDLRAGPRAQAVIGKASSQVGQPYVWGGGDKNGRTKGGWDCSGLMVYAFYQGTGGKVTLPRTSQEQRRVGKHVSKADMRPGDLIVINNDGNWGHVGLYIGDNRMVHAPRTGRDVTRDGLDYWKQFPWDVRRVL